MDHRRLLHQPAARNKLICGEVVLQEQLTNVIPRDKRGSMALSRPAYCLYRRCGPRLVILKHQRFGSPRKCRLNPAALLFNSSTVGNRRVGTQMRIPLVGCVLLAAIQPSFAQKFLTTEPLILDPYAVVYVSDGSYSAGKILEVRGAIRGLHRKKSCVPASAVSES